MRENNVGSAQFMLKPSEESLESSSLSLSGVVLNKLVDVSLGSRVPAVRNAKGGLEDDPEDDGDESSSKFANKSLHPRDKSEPPQKSKTPNIDKYGRDLTALAQDGKLDPVIGRAEEIERMVEILLRKTKCNPVLLGEAGVGKTAIVEGLAAKIVNDEIPVLSGKRVVALDLAAMVAGTQYRGQFEERIKNVMQEVRKNKNIILFIDELHTLVGAGGASGSMDAANMLKPALSRGELNVIGATTYDEYRKYIEGDAALSRRFQSVDVKEPSQADTLKILAGTIDRYEKHHRVKYPAESLKLAVDCAARYLAARRFPDKALDIVDEAGARLATFKRGAAESERIVGEKEILEVVSQMSGVPLGQVSVEEKSQLLNLEENLSKDVIGQPEAISRISKALRRARAGLRDPNRPIGTFLFVGPTGVGKTHLVKMLAREMFGSEDAVTQIDMSEYMEEHSVSKIIGAPPGYVGYEEGGQLTERIRRKPYSVVLLDEVEKAHPKVMDIFLQAFEEGHLTDSLGRKIDCRNVIFIMTSNRGVEFASQNPFGLRSRKQADETGYTDMAGKIMEVVNGSFRPEFMNRVDATIVFRKLDRQQGMAIVKREVSKFLKRANAQGYELEVSPEACELIFEKGFSEQYGARPIRKTAETILADTFSEAHLKGAIPKKMPIIITRDGNGVQFVPVENVPTPKIEERQAVQSA